MLKRAPNSFQNFKELQNPVSSRVKNRLKLFQETQTQAKLSTNIIKRKAQPRKKRVYFWDLRKSANNGRQSVGICLLLKRPRRQTSMRKQYRPSLKPQWSHNPQKFDSGRLLALFDVKIVNMNIKHAFSQKCIKINCN